MGRREVFGGARRKETGSLGLAQGEEGPVSRGASSGSASAACRRGACMCAQVPATGPDPSVKAGQMTSQVAAALAAARNADRSQRGAAHYHAAAGDASVRFGQAHFAQTQEGFARQFGPYAGHSRDP